MRICVNGKTLFFDVEGTGWVPGEEGMAPKPTLILLHGAPGNSDHSVFKPDFSVLADAAQIIYLDLSGAGRSEDEPDDHFSLERWADDLLAFCNALGIEKPVVLGVSGGGFVAQCYGARHPDHPGGLILASTQAVLDTERSIAEFQRLGGPAAATAAREFLQVRVDGESTRAFATHCNPVYNPTPQPARNTVIFRPKLAKAFHELGGIWHRMDLRAELPKITAPTLVLAGDDDPITPLQDSLDIFHALNPEIAELAHFAVAGHGPWRDQPEAVFARLRAFLKGPVKVIDTH